MSTGTHRHKCGFGIGGFQALLMGEPTGGCGHVWEHADKGKDEPIMDEPHFCPNCGSGPWVLHYSPRTCEVKRVPYVVPEHVGGDFPEFQTLACEATKIPGGREFLKDLHLALHSCMEVRHD